MESDKYNVQIAPSADRKLASHIEFLARVSENAAARLYKDYEETLGFRKRYRIVSEIVGDNVYAYDIQDCRQDTDNNLI